jgi:large subunit ribosomal protein L19e
MANLKIQKKTAAKIMKCSPSKVSFDTESLDDIKESITRQDVRGLISSGAIFKKSSNKTSRVRARKILLQKTKGKRKGHGSRKGKATARESKKDTWMNKVRKQRLFLRLIKTKGLITKGNYRMLMNKTKGGFFRSERHLKTYLGERNLFVVNSAESGSGSKKKDTKQNI